MNKKGVLATIGAGALAGAAVSGGKVKDYLCYLEVRKGDGPPRPYVVEIGKHSIEDVKARFKLALASRVQESAPLEVADREEHA